MRKANAGMFATGMTTVRNGVSLCILTIGDGPNAKAAATGGVNMPGAVTGAKAAGLRSGK
jgi:hypothetical protein